MDDPKPMGERIRVKADGTADVCGIDYECRPIIHAMNDETIVLRLPGRNVWNGNSRPRRYISPEMLVFGIIEAAGNNQFIVKPLVRWSLGRTSK